MPATPLTSAWPPSRPSVPTSRATRVTSSANADSVPTIRLIVAASAATSPIASTVICWLRSPRSTAVATWAMDRTCPVRLDAITLTLSVRSFQVPDTPRTTAWPPSLPSVPTSRATRVTSSANADSWSTIVLMVSFSSRISPRASTRIFWLRSPLATAVVTSAMDRTCPVRLAAIDVDGLGQVLPGARHALDIRLAAEQALGAHLAGHPGHLVGEGRQLVHHRVQRGLELQDLAARIHVDLLAQVAPGHRGRHLGDVAHLAGEVAGHRVHRLGQVLPGARHAGYVRLAAEFALGAHLAGHPGHLGGEQVELVCHPVEDGGDLVHQGVARLRQAGTEIAASYRGQASEQLLEARFVEPRTGLDRISHQALPSAAPPRSDARSARSCDLYRW